MKILSKALSIALALAFGTCVAAGQTKAGDAAGTKPAAEKSADAPAYPLSEEQRRAIQSILTKSKIEGAALLLNGAQGAKEFDDNILSDKPDAEADRKAHSKLADALAGATDLRLETIREVVALLTPEQKRILKAEMAKPGMHEGLLDVMARVFGLSDK